MHVTRKLMLVATALALPLGTATLIVSAGPAGAVVTANGTINCTAVSGSEKFSPAIETTGDSNKLTATTVVTLKSCTYTSNNIGSGTVTGTAKSTAVLTTTNNSANSCTALATAASKAVAYNTTWKDSNGTALAPTKLTYSGFDILLNGSGSTQHAGTDFPQDASGTATGFSGSFGGSNTGSSSESNFWIKQTVSQITGPTGCGNAATDGVKSVSFGQPGTTADPSHSFNG